MVATCNQDDRVAGMSGIVSAPAVELAVVLNSAIRITVRGRRVERAQMVVAVIPFPPFPRLFAVRLSVARRLLIV